MLLLDIGKTKVSSHGECKEQWKHRVIATLASVVSTGQIEEESNTLGCFLKTQKTHHFVLSRNWVSHCTLFWI